MSDEGEFRYGEEALARVLGLPREQLAAVRLGTLRPDEHWRLQSRVVMFSKEGVASLLRGLNVDLPKKSADPDAMTWGRLLRQGQVTPPEETAEREFVVGAVRRHNRKLMDAVDGTVLRVQDNRNYVVGDVVTAVYGGIDVWDVMGAGPRTKFRE